MSHCVVMARITGENSEVEASKVESSRDSTETAEPGRYQHIALPTYRQEKKPDMAGGHVAYEDILEVVAPKSHFCPVFLL